PILPATPSTMTSPSRERNVSTSSAGGALSRSSSCATDVIEEGSVDASDTVCRSYPRLPAPGPFLRPAQRRRCRVTDVTVPSGLTIRPMTPADVGAGLRLCRAAHWNQLARDWEAFLTRDPDGARVACRDDGFVVGSVATIRY